jgi:hypothetical protein
LGPSSHGSHSHGHGNQGYPSRPRYHQNANSWKRPQYPPRGPSNRGGRTGAYERPQHHQSFRKQNQDFDLVAFRVRFSSSHLYISHFAIVRLKWCNLNCI